MLIYKRTLPTTHPELDCAYMRDSLGVACAMFEITNSTSDYTCATRAQGMASHFSFHNIRDDFEPKGVAEHWIQTINHVHADFGGASEEAASGDDDVPTAVRATDDGAAGRRALSAGGEKWDQFMALSVGLFMPDLTELIVRWKANGLGYRARIYDSTVDGTTTYVLMTVDKYTGQVYEVRNTPPTTERAGAGASRGGGEPQGHRPNPNESPNDDHPSPSNRRQTNREAHRQIKARLKTAVEQSPSPPPSNHQATTKPPTKPPWRALRITRLNQQAGGSPAEAKAGGVEGGGSQ